MYKILFSDLDETLLDKTLHVPQINQEAIAKMRAKGHYFVATTGRGYDMCSDVLKETGQWQKENEYMIGFNGGMIIECKNFKELYFKGMSYEMLKEIYDYMKPRKYCTMVFCASCVYIINPNELEVWRKTTQKANFKIIGEDDLELIKDERIVKVLYAKSDNMDVFKQIEKEMPCILDGRIQVTYSSGRYMEFNSPGISKGAAVKWLSDYLGIDISQTVAIGDNLNDIEMLLAAGYSCCVKSGVEEAKRICDYVTQLDYSDGAVAEVIDKYFL